MRTAVASRSEDGLVTEAVRLSPSHKAQQQIRAAARGKIEEKELLL